MSHVEPVKERDGGENKRDGMSEANDLVGRRSSRET